MNLPPPVVEWCRTRGWGEIAGSGAAKRRAASTAAIDCELPDGALFLKTNHDVPEDLFQREAQGLEALSGRRRPTRSPATAVGRESFLLLEDLAPAAETPEFWERLGRELARMHSRISQRFGFDHDNYLGRTPQPNPWSDDGGSSSAVTASSSRRSAPTAPGCSSAGDVHGVEIIAGRLAALVPEEEACLIHGDLWSGNVLPGPNGEPCLIDPACHYGWAEAELAMTELFGGFPERFYHAYAEARPLIPGWRERFPVYNLYHLLNHLNLFGVGYLGPVRSILHQLA